MLPLYGYTVTPAAARARVVLSGEINCSRMSASPAMTWLVATVASGVNRQIRRRMKGRPRKNVESAVSSTV